jgi:glyoxylase-like metal-dependent hydrolase (beta-lactamase superfamily II)
LSSIAPCLRVTRRQFSAMLVATTGLRLRAQPARTGLHELRGGAGIFVGPGGTMGWLAMGDAAVIVDSQFPATARECLDALRQRSALNDVVLINTHHHGDHTAGNGVLRPFVRQIVQHEQCARQHAQALSSAGADGRAGLAEVTFADRWSTSVGDERVSASWYGAAHTGGDAIVVFERAGVVHVGDLVFNRVPPFVDRAAGASMRNWIAVLERLLRQHAGATFVFGHGRQDAVTGTGKDVAHFRDYLSAVLEHVQRGLASGRAMQDIVALDTLPGFAEFGDVVKNYASPNPLFSLAHVLTAAYQELTGPPQ